jgi:hypothetical protein
MNFKQTTDLFITLSDLGYKRSAELKDDEL